MLSAPPVCSVWWIPINLIFGGPIVSLHVILQLKDSPHGKQICYQEVRWCHRGGGPHVLLHVILQPKDLCGHPQGHLLSGGVK